MVNEKPSPPAESDRGNLADPLQRLHLWQIQGIRDVATLAALLLLVYVGYWMRDVTVPLLIALTLAYLFEPVVQRLCRFRGITRPGAVLIILLTVGVTVTIAVAFTVPLAIGQTIRLINQVRATDVPALASRIVEYAPEQYREDLRNAADWVERQLRDTPEPPAAGLPVEASPGRPGPDSEATPNATVESAPPDGAAVPERSEEWVRSVVRAELESRGLDLVAGTAVAGGGSGRGAAMRIMGVLGPTAQSVFDFLLALVQFSLLAFLIPFYFYFFSVSFPRVLAFGESVIPERRRQSALQLIAAMDRAVSGFVRGRIVICSVMGLLFAIGWLLCGVPYAITLGLFVGAISLVPYLGGLGLPLAIGFLLFDQLHLPAEARMAWWGILLWPTAVFVVVQVIEGYLLTPMIAGKATDLDPVTIVVAILAGGSVAGVYGMLLAIPAAACGKILLKEMVMPRLRAWSRGETTDPLPIGPIEQAPPSPGRPASGS